VPPLDGFLFRAALDVGHGAGDGFAVAGRGGVTPWVSSARASAGDAPVMNA